MLEVQAEATVDEKPTSEIADTQAQEPASAETQTEVDAKPKEPDPAQETKKALKGVQKRIDELTRARYEAEERGRQEAEAARQEALYWRQQAEQAKAKVGPPKFADFQDLEQYTAAMAAHKAEEIASQKIEAERRMAWENYQRQQQQAMAVQQQAAYQQAVNQKIAEAQKKYPDFMEVITSPELPGLQGTAAFNAILESEVGAEVAYYLGKNPARAHQIASMPPISQVREIGRIEAAVQSGNVVSKAPPPPSSVDGKSGTATKDVRNMTPDEYYRHITRRAKTS